MCWLPPDSNNLKWATQKKNNLKWASRGSINSPTTIQYYRINETLSGWVSYHPEPFSQPHSRWSLSCKATFVCVIAPTVHLSVHPGLKGFLPKPSAAKHALWVIRPCFHRRLSAFVPDHLVQRKFIWWWMLFFTWLSSKFALHRPSIFWCRRRTNTLDFYYGLGILRMIYTFWL